MYGDHSGICISSTVKQHGISHHARCTPLQLQSRTFREEQAWILRSRTRCCIHLASDLNTAGMFCLHSAIRPRSIVRFSREQLGSRNIPSSGAYWWSLSRNKVSVLDTWLSPPVRYRCRQDLLPSPGSCRCGNSSSRRLSGALCTPPDSDVVCRAQENVTQTGLESQDLVRNGRKPQSIPQPRL